MKLKPLGRRLSIEPETKTMTESGIHLPETVQEGFFGTIVSVGPKVKKLKPGQKVMYDKYTGNQYGKQIILFEYNVIALVEEG